jgi:hypothetical protein
MDWTTEGSEFESQWGQQFSPLHVIQTIHPIHCVLGCFPLGVKQLGREADHSPQTIAEVKKMCIGNNDPYYIIMRYLTLIDFSVLVLLL